MEKYVREILAHDIPSSKKQKMHVISKLIELRIDNRILNNMRQTMNESIQDERGLMTIEEFQKMFFTSFGPKNI